MNKYSFLYPITLALFVPLAYAMEQENPINPNVFTKECKEYMEYAVQVWVSAAEVAEVNTGLAVIFKEIQITGIDNLICDEEILKKANLGLVAMQKDPVFKTLPDLQKINTYLYDGAKKLRADLSRVVTQAVAMNVLVTVYPEFKIPYFDSPLDGGLITVFAALEQERVSDNIEFLKLNAHLDSKDVSYIGALTLIMGYLAQTGAGR